MCQDEYDSLLEEFLEVMSLLEERELFLVGLNSEIDYLNDRSDDLMTILKEHEECFGNE